MFIGLSAFCFSLLFLTVVLSLFFFKKGFLDEQFNQLQQLQDESNPDFVVEVVTLFFHKNTVRALQFPVLLYIFRPSNHVSLGTSFPTPHFNNVDSFVSNRGQPSTDFKKLDALVHQLKGSSSR